MKKIMSFILCVTILLSVIAFSGCSKQDLNTPSTVLVEVLAVNDDGFVTKLDGYGCYVNYHHAPQFVSTGDIIELTYYLYNHIMTDDEMNINGVTYTTVLTNVENLIVK